MTSRLSGDISIFGFGFRCSSPLGIRDNGLSAILSVKPRIQVSILIYMYRKWAIEIACKDMLKSLFIKYPTISA